MSLRDKIISKEEIESFLKPSDLRGFQALFTTWGLISFSFLLVAYFQNTITFVIAIILIGGRHLALAILMHDCAHYSLFKTRWLNDFIGTWFCSYPTWQDLRRYREHHFAHHQWAGTPKDPDLDLIKGFDRLARIDPPLLTDTDPPNWPELTHVGG